MSRQPIADDVKSSIVEFYKQGLTNQAIANLTGVSIASVINIVRESIKKGLITPKHGNFGKKRNKNGQGSKYQKKGYNPKRKLSIEQENQLLDDYFNKGYTYKMIMKKYDIWQRTLRLIINRAVGKGLYTPKGKGNKKRKEKEFYDDTRQGN